MRVLFDSGAETNVISYELLKQLEQEGMRTRLDRVNGRLKCANGSLINIMGYTTVEIQIGTKQVPIKFTVVENIFPKIIVGLRMMKQWKIDIIPSNDCIRVEGVDIPFMSKTYTASEN